MVTNHSLPNPRISIITCTCNSEEFLMRALESIECQTYRNIEHIINDSFSTDASLPIIQNYIARNKDEYTIKLIHSEPKVSGERTQRCDQRSDRRHHSLPAFR